MSFLLTAAILITLLVFFWSTICSFLSKHFLPWVKTAFGDDVCDLMTSLICWLDRNIRGIRRGLKNAFRFFKERVLRIHTTYSTTNGRTVKKKTEGVFKNDNNDLVVIEEEQDLSMDDLSFEFQEEIIRQKANESKVKEVEVDENEVINQQVKKRCEEDRKISQSQEEEEEILSILELAN